MLKDDTGFDDQPERALEAVEEDTDVIPTSRLSERNYEGQICQPKESQFNMQHHRLAEPLNHSTQINTASEQSQFDDLQETQRDTINKGPTLRQEMTKAREKSVQSTKAQQPKNLFQKVSSHKIDFD